MAVLHRALRKSIQAICEERFIRLEVLNRALSTLAPDLAGDSALSRVLDLLPDAPQELQHDFLLLPELIVWMRGLRHQLETWLPLPSRRLSLSQQLDHLRTLALRLLMAAQPTVIAIRIPATGVLVLLQAQAFRSFLPTLMARGWWIRKVTTSRFQFKPIGCSVAWREPISSNFQKRKTHGRVVYHAQLTGQVTLRTSCHWDRMPGNQPIIHPGSRTGEQSAPPRELIDAWNEVRQDALRRWSYGPGASASSIRVVIVNPFEVGHSEWGWPASTWTSRAEEAHHEFRGALSATFCLVDQGSSPPTEELRLIELTYFNQIETALMNG